MRTPLSELSPGDRFRYPLLEPTIVAEVLRRVEPRRDTFGREMCGLWCRVAEATDGAPVEVGKEGFLTFGPSFEGLEVLA